MVKNDGWHDRNWDWGIKKTEIGYVRKGDLEVKMKLAGGELLDVKNAMYQVEIRAVLIDEVWV